MSRALRLAAPIAWMGVLWMLSALPTAPDQTTAGIFIPKLLQKTLHLVAYAILASTWLWVLDPERSPSARGFSAICLTTAYAAVDEYHQTFVAGRTGSPWDVALDAFGATLAVIAVVAWCDGSTGQSRASSWISR
jgi:VanZ family protein